MTRRKPKRAPRKCRLNDRMLKHLKKEPVPFLIWDTVQKGLCVQMQPTGAATYKVIYSRNGRPRWYTLARVGAIKLAQARTEANAVMYQVTQGGDPAAVRRAERGAGTFQELADRYRAYAKRKNKSWEQADRLIKKYLSPKWAKLPAASITRSDVRTQLARITAPVLSNQVLAAASAVFSYAIREEVGGIKVNPATGIERNATVSRERVLSDNEVPAFWNAFEEAGLTRCMALRVLLLTGQRPGEVACMRTEHIEDGWWTLPGHRIEELGWAGTKNAQTHRVWLPVPAQRIIEEMDASGFVFANERGNACTDLARAMRGVCEKLGVAEKLTPHDLRRTHGTTITGLGFSRDAMNRIQNHKEGGIASVYDRHQYAEENKRIMEAVAARIMELVAGRPGASNVVALR